MKKLLSVVLVVLMVFSLFACGKKTPAVPEITDTSLEVLNKVWEKIGGEFPVIGGDANEDWSHIVDGAPGTFDVKNTQALSNQLYVPEALQSGIQDCASLMHMMNANTLTIAAFKAPGASDFAKSMRDTLVGNQWMCGMPEKVYVATLGANDYVVAFGVADVIEDLDKTLGELYGSAVTVNYNEAM